jgi:hypothetical protein
MQSLAKNEIRQRMYIYTGYIRRYKRTEPESGNCKKGEPRRRNKVVVDRGRPRSAVIV